MSVAVPTPRPLPGVRPNPGHPMVRGGRLRACWLFNEGAGALLNDCGPWGRNLAAGPGITSSPWSGAGGNPLGGPAVTLGGTTTSYLQAVDRTGVATTAGADLFDTNVGSAFEVWCNPTNVVGWKAIVNQNRDAAASWWGLWVSDLSKWAFGTGAANNLLGIRSITPGWYHVICTRRGVDGQKTIYDWRLSDNTLEVTTGTDATSSSSGATFFVGKGQGTAETFAGAVALVRVYAGHVLPAEAADLHADPFGMFRWPAGPWSPVGLLDQEGYQFRNDDGSESAATGKAAQDTGITAAPDANVRVRILVNSTNDSPANQYQLEYRVNGVGGWRPVLPP